MKKTNANIVKVLTAQQENAKFLRDMYRKEGKTELGEYYNGLYFGYESSIILLTQPADYLTSIAEIYAIK